MKNIVVLAAISLLIFSCAKHDEWITIVYQSKQKLFEYKAGLSTTLKECKEEGVKSLKGLGIEDTGTFECGLNCKSEGILLVCEMVVDYGR